MQLRMVIGIVTRIAIIEIMIMIIICISIGIGRNHAECRVQSASAPRYPLPPPSLVYFHPSLLLRVVGGYLLLLGYGYLSDSKGVSIK